MPDALQPIDPVTVAAPGRRTAEGAAPGKLILLGEHAVVHGELALAVPFSPLRARARVRPVPGPLALETPFWSGPFEAASEVPARLQGLAALIIEALAALEAPARGLAIALDSTIPLGAGLGSSAAVAVALARALYAAHGRVLDAPQEQALARVAEHAAHGNPSGVDAATVASDRPIAFRRGEAVRSLAIAGTFELLVADCGTAGDTRAAVAAVAAALAADAAGTSERLARLGAIARAGEAALAAGDAPALGDLMDAAQIALAALGVSDPALERLLTAARAAGALGAKLTGAGRGGCIVALAPAGAGAQVAAALARAGARQVWPLTLAPPPPPAHPEASPL